MWEQTAYGQRCFKFPQFYLLWSHTDPKPSRPIMLTWEFGWNKPQKKPTDHLHFSLKAFWKHLDQLCWGAPGSTESEGPSLSSTTCRRNEEPANASAVSGLLASRHFRLEGWRLWFHTEWLRTPHAAGTALGAAARSTRTAEKFLSADSSGYPILMEKGVLIPNRAAQKPGQQVLAENTDMNSQTQKHRLSWKILTGKLSKERVSLHMQLPLRQKGVADMNWGLCKQQYNVKQIFFD